MKTWSAEDLTRIGEAAEIRIAPEGRDGAARRPTTIWVVRNGDDLYVRSANGPEGHWYRTAETSHRGRIEVAGLVRDVTFVNTTEPFVNDEIDAAYLKKYGSTPWAEPMTQPGPRGTTLRLEPA
ncbi:DUF2255 family protein [Actinomadura rupiterrae]|uniref:DUF2255 family protein n=1 Tax=Actinomadura rupiterrae TaxID=559627 RepID=UPI0020A5F559|nr:DUF2255 family protein [Actinomadura rupiterrae]MCP2342435.1 hypothetical protein [Actinomadura rupiterrae]